MKPAAVALVVGWSFVALANGDTTGPPLSVQAGSVIDTGRYTITIGDLDTRVDDTESNTWIQVAGHWVVYPTYGTVYQSNLVTTSDGDLGQANFKNLTINLLDGTKVTLIHEQTEVAGFGDVLVSKGNDSVFVGRSFPERRFNNLEQMKGVNLDPAYPDGTVFNAGPEVDDLFGVLQGVVREFAGTDPTQQFNAVYLDAWENDPLPVTPVPEPTASTPTIIHPPGDTVWVSDDLVQWTALTPTNATAPAFPGIRAEFLGNQTGLHIADVYFEEHPAVFSRTEVPE